MIARTWTAEVTLEREAEYLETVRHVVLPKLRSVDGYRGAQFLREANGALVAVLVVSYWESPEAIGRLSTGAPTDAYVPEEIAITLERFDTVARHYEVVVDDFPFAS